ncbi:hypothetical protein [Pyxidicoccus xibeiensis]|uniref:hypothetical protein n=1 Tax=Pyxidicoccus xibeiensis TaxID=2906759 RepID=UPI0020A78282|nr:hypothetical protein [Pyxidicoccus xibeiensis]MCP3142276.1 hypothetical protein [Pyxidicoccus xibeiensis]
MADRYFCIQCGVDGDRPGPCHACRDGRIVSQRLVEDAPFTPLPPPVQPQRDGVFEALEQVVTRLQASDFNALEVLPALLLVTGRDGLCAGRMVSAETLSFECSEGRREYAVPDAPLRLARILAVLIEALGVGLNGGAELFTCQLEGRVFKYSAEIANGKGEASFVLRRLEWLEPGADPMGRTALAARRLLGDSQGLCVVDWHLADAPDSRYLIARVQGDRGELVRRRGRHDQRRFSMSRKSLESLMESLRAAGLFELEDAPWEETATMLDGQYLGVAMNWGPVRRSRQSENPQPHRGLDAINWLMGASALSLRLKCFWGTWR